MRLVIRSCQPWERKRYEIRNRDGSAIIDVYDRGPPLRENRVVLAWTWFDGGMWSLEFRTDEHVPVVRCDDRLVAKGELHCPHFWQRGTVAMHYAIEHPTFKGRIRVQGCFRRVMIQAEPQRIVARVLRRRCLSNARHLVYARRWNHLGPLLTALILYEFDGRTTSTSG